MTSAAVSLRPERAAARWVGWGAGSYFQRVFAAEPIRPRFLVDGDPDKWGQEICGVPVRPPEALRQEDPARTRVVLYSTAHREIAGQVAQYGSFRTATPFEMDEYTAAQDARVGVADGGGPWLARALEEIRIERPVIVLGKGPGLALAPPEIADTHFVVSINQAFAAVGRADLVFSLDIHHVVHALFDPRLSRCWRRYFLPNGISNRWDGLDLTGLPHGPESFRDVREALARGWLSTRMPFDAVDRVLDLSRFGDRIVRFRVVDAGRQEEPLCREEFRAEAVEENALRHHANSGHLAFYFLFLKGVREVLTAGIGADDGYHGFDFPIRHPEEPGGQRAYIHRRWQITREILALLGIRYRRLEDLGPAEIAALARPG